MSFNDIKFEADGYLASINGQGNVSSSVNLNRDGSLSNNCYAAEAAVAKLGGILGDSGKLPSPLE